MCHPHGRCLYSITKARNLQNVDTKKLTILKNQITKSFPPAPGTDEINPNAPSYYSNQRFGLIPPDTPCNPCYNQFGSDSSFVNTALKEGLRRNELFTECSYPTMSRTIKIWGAVASEEDRYGGSGGLYDLSDEKYGASHYGFTPPTITVGVSLEVVEAEVVSCVMEKLVNRIAEGGWEFIPSLTVDTLYFRKQTRQT